MGGTRPCLSLSDEGGECELLFFRRLDNEFDKVLGFCKKKVEEVVAEADELINADECIDHSFASGSRNCSWDYRGPTLASLPWVSRHPQSPLLLTVQGQVRWGAH